MSDTLHEVEARVLKRIEEDRKNPKPNTNTKDSWDAYRRSTIPAVIAACL